MADLDYIINFASDTLGLDRANSAIGKVGVALAALGVGFATFKVAGFLSDAVKGASDFEQQLATVQAVSGATVEQMDRIKEASVELGKSTRYNATQAAEGFEILARAGLNTEQALETIPSVLALAQGNALGLSEAAGFVTKAVQGMGLEFSESARVADVLAKASASANTDVSGLGAALSYAAPTANALGLTLEETAAYIGKFADAGVDASRAGTALNGILSQFGNSASTFKRELANIGITTNDFNEAVRQLAASGDKGQKAINALGLEAGPAFKALLSQGMPALDELTEKLRGAGGAAAEQAEIMNNTWQGAFASLDSVWQSVKDTIGEPILEPLSQAFKDIGAVIGELIDSGKIEQLGASIGEVFTEATVYIVDFIKNIDMAEVIDRVSNSLETLRGISVAANGAFQALSIFFNGLKNGVLAIGVALSMLLTVGVEVHKFFVDTGLAIAKFFGFTGTAIEGYSKSLGGALKASEDFRAYADEEMAKTAESIHKSFNSIAGSADEAAKSTEESGGTIAEVFKGITESAFEGAQETGKSLEQIRKDTAKMIEGFSAPEEFASLLKVITETGQAATVGSEIMNRLIVGAGGLAGTHKTVIEDANQSMKDFGMTAEGVAEKTRQAIEGTFSALNIDVQQNLNGINSKTQETFDLVANGAKSISESTYSATEQASLLSALFEKGLNAAKTKEEFIALNEVTKHYGLSSVITAEQQKILQAGMKGGAEAAELASDAINKHTLALGGNANVANTNTVAIRENTAARKEQSTSTWNAKFATDAANQSESASLAFMQQVTGAIKNKISALEGMSVTTEQTNAVWNNLMDSLGHFEGKRWLGIADFTRDMQRMDDVVKSQVSSFEQAKNRAEQMSQALSGNAVSSRDLADAQAALRKATDASIQGVIRMDNQTLDKLKGAIDSARQRMQGLADDAKNTADSLEAALAKMQGNEDKARDIEQTRKLTELQEKLNEAKARGNNEEAAQLSRALELQKQINREEDKKAREMETTAREKSVANTAQVNTSGNKNSASSRTIDVNFNVGGRSVNATIPEAQQSTFEQMMKELQDSKAIAGY